jgi:O-antigen ligase
MLSEHKPWNRWPLFAPGARSSWWLLKAGIVLGVLSASAVLGAVAWRVADRFDPLLLIVAGAVPASLLALNWLVRHRPWMPVLILAAAAFTPFTLPTGRGSRIVDSLLLTMVFAGLWLLRMLTVERRFSLRPTPLNLPLLLFMAMTAWSLVWSNLYRDPLVAIWGSFPFVQILSGLTNILLCVAFLMVYNFIEDLRLLKALTGVMLAAAALGLLKRYELIPASIGDLIVNTGGLFTMWCIALGAALALYCSRWHWGWRVLAAAMAVLYVIWGLILHISWLAGWLPGLVALSVLIWQHSRKAVVLMLIGVMAFAAFNYAEFEQAFAAENEESGQTRLAAWVQNWKITKDHLLFGTGPGGYAVYYMSYFPREAMATHSNYIDMLSQNGLAGFLPMLAFFAGIAWIGYRLTRRLRRRGDFVEGLANASFAGTLGCIVAMGFGDWLFPFAYTQTIEGFDYAVYNFLFMGATLVLDRLTKPGMPLAAPEPAHA